jgi:hypothetical protein
MSIKHDPRPQFVVHRSGQRSFAQRRPSLLTPQALVILFVFLFLPCGAYVASLEGSAFSFQGGWISHPKPLPVVPEVVDRLALGMTPEEVEAAGEGLDSRGFYQPSGAFPSQYPADGPGAYRFFGYPRDYPKNVVLGDLPVLRGTLTFEDDRLVGLRVLSQEHGPEVGTADVVGGVLGELQARLREGERAPLTLDEVEEELGYGLRVGRLIREGARPSSVSVYRWSYTGWVDGTLGALADLDLCVDADGTVVGLGSDW